MTYETLNQQKKNNQISTRHPYEKYTNLAFLQAQQVFNNTTNITKLTF